MSPPAESDESIERIDRIFAFMSLGLLLLSVVCFLAIIIATPLGANFQSGIWPVVSVLVYFAPVIAFVLLLVVLIRGFRRKARENRQG